MISPYEAGLRTANNLGDAFQNSRENSKIESILSEAMSTGNPKILQNSLAKILTQVSTEKQPAVMKVLENEMIRIDKKQMMQKQQNAAKNLGIDENIVNLPANLQGEVLKGQNKDRYLNNIFGQQQKGQEMQGGQPQGQPMGPNPQMQGGQPNMSGQAMQPQNANSQTSRFANATKNELIALTGSPYKEVSEPAKTQLKYKEEQEKLEENRKIQNRKEEIQFHKESQKYDDDLAKQTRVAKSQMGTIANIEKSVNSGNVKPSSMANILKGMGPVGEKISEAIVNKDEAALLASIPTLLEGWKDVFGVRLTDADLRLLQDKLPSIGKTPEANRAILGILRKYAEVTQLRGKIASEIKSKNKGIRPIGYQDMIEERFDEMMKPIKIRNPNSGRVVEIPSYLASDFINDGGVVVDE